MTDVIILRRFLSHNKDTVSEDASLNAAVKHLRTIEEFFNNAVARKHEFADAPFEGNERDALWESFKQRVGAGLASTRANEMSHAFGELHLRLRTVVR